MRLWWFRKYYPPDSDEPHYDATAAVEKAMTWVRSLEEHAFIGTESRLNMIFDLLRQMTFGTETDPEARLAELTRRRHEIDQEIARDGQVLSEDRCVLKLVRGIESQRTRVRDCRASDAHQADWRHRGRSDSVSLRPRGSRGAMCLRPGARTAWASPDGRTE
ncbi:DUF3375 family protein [Streptomyces decoyicus]